MIKKNNIKVKDNLKFIARSNIEIIKIVNKSLKKLIVSSMISEAALISLLKNEKIKNYL